MFCSDAHWGGWVLEGGRSQILVNFRLILGRQELIFVTFSFSCASASIQTTKKKKDQGTDFGELGFLHFPSALTNLHPVLFFFVISLVIVTLRYNFLFIPLILFFLAAISHSIGFLSVWPGLVNALLARGAVPTMPQAFSLGLPHICSLSPVPSTQAFQQIDNLLGITGNTG
ncbi:hypothetical protein L211DRAFT_227121 [Terfezia boudieri ATCC MYA-4762]|uniref:Uncharacterized protein n=1 Tax=Terfezia boudieri ATCC MYA-4762 TaxID=1051890 RepID=A0A3N4M0M0_9PEZI|nr:hypothetical protein L211DRAFT_227121 [Terfezia boudieri ATCC MYA-4762]